MGCLISSSQDKFVAVFKTTHECCCEWKAPATHLLSLEKVSVNGLNRRGEVALNVAMDMAVKSSGEPQQNLDKVRWLLSKGAMPRCNFCQSCSNYLLNAVCRQKLQLVKLLLDNGLKFTDYNIREAFIVAKGIELSGNLYCDYIRALQRNMLILLDRAAGEFYGRSGAAVFNKAFLCSTYHSFAAVYFLSVNCDPHGPDSNRETSEPWARMYDPLYWAIHRKATPLVNILLNLGCRMFEQHRTEAVKLGDAEVVARLSQPHSLQTLCMAAIRSQLRQRGAVGHRFEPAARDLPLPGPLKNSVMLADLKQLVVDEEATLCDGQKYSLRRRTRLVIHPHT